MTATVYISKLTKCNQLRGYTIVVSHLSGQKGADFTAIVSALNVHDPKVMQFNMQGSL